MTDLQRVKISLLIASARFWVIIFVLYLTTKSFSSEQAFISIGIFYIASVILEFPTGVIGDYFSHKLSIILGYFSLILSMIVLLSITSFWQLMIFGILAALGAALISGSNTALLHSVSKDFKKDSVQLSIFSTIISAFALALGSWLASYDFNYAFYFQIFIFVSATIFLIPVKIKKQEKERGNIFATAKEGLKNVFIDNHLLHLTIFSSLITSLFLNLKWFYNPLFMELKIDVVYWGILGGIAFLFIPLGSFLYKKFSKINILLASLFLFISIFFMGVTKFSVLAVLGLFLVHIMRGFFGVKFNVDTNKIVKPIARASVLSFQSLLTRLISMIIVFISGFILERFSFFVLMCVVAVFLFTFGIYSVLKINKFE
ncbi:MAG: MFS transporter [Candidatus Moranbacteria bacterium]|nr:MFS transporter [Candidatus Moranbacteria bacterium]